MYSFISGIVDDISDGKIILDCNFIGYEISVPDNTDYLMIRVGDELKLWTHLSVSQDNIALYGFLSKMECDLFKKLIGVSGIGPKGALGMLGKMNSDDLILAIMSEDEDAISASPGIGKKTARKLILELKDKLTTSDIGLDINKDIVFDKTKSGDDKSEAIEALCALGYSKSEAIAAVNKFEIHEGDSVEEILKGALAFL